MSWPSYVSDHMKTEGVPSLSKRQERMTPEWKTFRVENLVQDRIVLLFDMLYEYRQVFKQQYWMGVITMQNPFDMYSIQDIIYSTRPDLLIETGASIVFAPW